MLTLGQFITVFSDIDNVLVVIEDESTLEVYGNYGDYKRIPCQLPMKREGKHFRFTSYYFRDKGKKILKVLVQYQSQIKRERLMC